MEQACPHCGGKATSADVFQLNTLKCNKCKRIVRGDVAIVIGAPAQDNSNIVQENPSQPLLMHKPPPSFHNIVLPAQPGNPLQCQEADCDRTATQRCHKCHQMLCLAHVFPYQMSGRDVTVTHWYCARCRQSVRDTRNCGLVALGMMAGLVLIILAVIAK